MQVIDDQAILGCQSGDRDSFRHLVDRYKDVLYGTAFLMTKDRSLAEDQVQETLLSAWKGIRGFNRDRPFKPWIMRILVNVFLSHQRRRRVATVPLAACPKIARGVLPMGRDQAVAAVRAAAELVRPARLAMIRMISARRGCLTAPAAASARILRG